MSWGMVASAAVTVVGGYLSSKKSKGGSGGGGGVYDPYSQYRPAAAAKLQDLMNNPDQAANTSYGKAMMQAAGRTMAAQGYTGSGNALVAAANAGGQAYQQEFNNLVTLSGAGQSPANAAAAADQQANYQQQQNNQMWGQIGGLVGGFVGGRSNSTSPTGVTTGDYYSRMGGNGAGNGSYGMMAPSSNGSVDYGFGGYSPDF